MKKLISILFVASVSLNILAQQLPLIPYPDQVERSSEKFVINKKTVITADPVFKTEAEYFQSQINKRTGILIPINYEKNTVKKNYIGLNVSEGSVQCLYSLAASEAQVLITATNSDGLFWGMQTLFQLLQNEKKRKVKIECVTICDKPRFGWRGMHLDCCRHFFTVDEVKKYLDYMAMYKMNVFHWHLTDDQGWRIEIKKYPELTKVAAYRKETIIGKQSDTSKFDGVRYGGFYTQEQIKDVVSYAAKLHITVVPEIEMPGHSLAALAAYPEYSCNGGPIEVGTQWGVFDDVFCPGKDETFNFLQDILDELFVLFPGKYIHIGGDECVKTRWKECPKCQARMQTENLKDENELQSYFITRMEKYINSKGRQIIGWDEILEGGLAPNAAVMSWRGTKGGIEAAKMKHNVVMTPGRPCYFDNYQYKPKEKEPLAIGGYNPLDSVYAYDPVPKELTPEESGYIMGAQGNVWTEYITSFSHVEYMALPRMAALAETLWLSPEKKDFKGFIERLKLNSEYLDQQGVNYCKRFKE